MDIEQMKKDLGGGNVFPIGEENVAFAKYFTGECYLNILTTERVPVGLVTLLQKQSMHTTSITRVARSLWLLVEEDGIRKKENRLVN